MTTSRSSGYLFRFSSFELDLRVRELRKNGLRIKLQDQPFQILALLLEKPGEIVTREELRDRLWSADTFVDFDHSLNSAVKKLRQALSDDPDVPRFIETLPRRGYRFIAPLRQGDEPGSAAIAASAGAHTIQESGQNSVARSVPLASLVAAGSRNWKLWAAGALGFALALALVAWLRTSRPAGISDSTPVRLVPLTASSSDLSKGSFSPDGNEVAFESNGDDPTQDSQIYIRQIGTDKPLQVTSGSGNNYFPVWSPDGRYIAFMHGGASERYGIYLVPALGGAARKLHEFAPGRGCSVSLSWSRDGKYLLYSERVGEQPASIQQLDLEDLSVRQVSTPPIPSVGDWNAEFSPDGKSIAFIRNSKEVEDIYVMPATGGAPRRLTFDDRLLAGLAWTPDSQELIFSSNRGGATWGLWRISVAGGTPVRASVGAEGAYMPDLSMTGNRLLYASGFLNENIWRFPIGPGHHLGKPTRLIFSSMQEEGPQYSPDGTRIAFQSTRSGNFEIWRADADGENLIQLTRFGGPLTGTPRWSPDGRQICFDSRPGAHSNIFVIGADGGPVRRLPNDTSDDTVPSWSHDGRSIYFASNRSGAWQVWRGNPDGGNPVQLTRDGGFAPLESPDGKSLYYTRSDEDGIWQAPVSGGQESKVLAEAPKNYWGYFAVGPDGLYFVGNAGTPEKPHLDFRYFDFATRKTIAIGDVDKMPSEGPGMSVSPNGKYLLFAQIDASRNSLMMAENFH